MTRFSVVLTAVAVLGCGEPSTPFVYCDESTVSAAVARSVNAGGLAFVDETEVTQSQYQHFLDATEGGSDVTGQPSFCEWNTSYAVDTDCLLGGLASERMLDDVLGCDSRPQTCVDFCDAYMYCESVGKHLCGSIEGGRLPLEEAGTTRSEWYIGCSGGGQHEYGPGAVADANEKCNTLACYETGSCRFPTELVPRPGTPVPPGSASECESPEALYSDIYEMTGNVMEWDNSCDGETGAADTCATRGGWFGSEARPCNETLGFPRTETFHGLGFRCCGSPEEP